MCTWILLIKILHFYTVQMVPINCIAAKNSCLDHIQYFTTKIQNIFREIQFWLKTNFPWTQALLSGWDWISKEEEFFRLISRIRNSLRVSERGGRSESCIYNPRIILTTNKQIQNENESWNFKLSYHDDEIMEQHRKEIYCNTLN